MVRLAGASTRNRNRQLSNKFRLKVIHGDVEADPVDVADEEGEKSQYTDLVAGVDAEDAHEHHLQEVLHASSQNASSHRSTRGAQNNNGQKAPPAPAFIPTPDSTGIVDHYADLYVPNRWKDPATYLYTSVTPEESCTNALADNFTYCMDERDKEWLDKNNEMARGEGTSAQGALSASMIRTSARSSKAKGKEPESVQSLAISEDEFELVMGLFEKVAHEKTEYLHHGLENGMAFPAFSEYQQTFSNPLPATTFASYSVPQWIPAPAHVFRIARTVYSHWRERRLERGGHRIIPILNYDEADTLNESYVCFRRREIKTVRKTRASQATSLDKLLRLQAELGFPLELGKNLLKREHLKREAARHTRQVWDKRILVTEFRRKHPSWGDKADEDLLVDKERPKKAELLRPPKIKSEVVAGTPIRSEVIAMRPTERISRINEVIETRLNHQKDQDQHWEDQIDDPYQIPIVPFSNRCFKYILNNSLSFSQRERPSRRIHRAVRTRVGRGGRLLVDRRDSVAPPIVPITRSSLFGDEDVEMEIDDDDQLKRMQGRWRYDADDVPAVGPEGSEEMNRVLVDDYSPQILRHSMMWLLDPDQQSLMNDPTIPVIQDGHQQFVVPFRLGLPPTRRLPAGTPRAGALLGHPRASPTASMSSGTPISVQQQLKKMPPPSSLPQMRISSNGGLRLSPVASMSGPSSMPQSSPPTSVTPVHHTPSSNGIHRAAINLPHIDPSRAEVNGMQSSLNGVMHVQPNLQPDVSHHQASKPNGAVLIPTPTQGLAPNGGTNGYHGVVSHTVPASQLGLQGNHGLSELQMQNLKTVFANAQAQAIQDNKSGARALPSYLQPGSANFNLQQQLAAVSNFNLKFPAARQMQWTGSASPVKSSISNGIDAQVAVSMTPPIVQASPVRVPSANGIRPGMRVGTNGQLGTHMSPHGQQNTLSIPASLIQSQSPPRVPLTPTMPRVSPSLQHQQPAGSSKTGY